MTIEELIEKLQELPGFLPVYIATGFDWDGLNFEKIQEEDFVIIKGKGFGLYL